MIFKKPLFITLLLLASTAQSISSQENKIIRFNTLTLERQVILQDNHTKLEWVNGKEQNQSKEQQDKIIDDGCSNFKLTEHHPLLNIKEKAQKYCNTLNFASYSDWRVPTDLEYQTLIHATQDSNSTHSAKNILALNKNQINIMHIENSDALGTIILGKDNDTTTCLRCVRSSEKTLSP